MSAKPIIGFVLLLGYIFSCEREEEPLENYSLIGKWIWNYSEGGYAGITETPESTGQNILIEFTPDSIYKQYLNGSLERQCEFHLTKRESIFNHETVNAISGIYPWDVLYRASGSTLRLDDNCVDGKMKMYSRTK